MKAKGVSGNVYPAPTIVVGVGRFGLSVLERLGEDWKWLSTSDAGDASLSNLRLLHLRADDDSSSGGWREGERPLAFLANYVGGNDLPMLALRLVILRSLGLVRYRGGTYQVALPKDAGAIDKRGNGETRGVRRRRFFKWINLSPDPLIAMERLRVEADRSGELDVFLTPIIERVCHGHSPAVLMGLIGRCRALLEGRDPSPWPWLDKRWGDKVDEPGRDSGDVRLSFSREWLEADDELGLLEGTAPEPMAGWNRWWFEFEALKPDRQRNFGVKTPDSMLDVHVPAVFLPTEHDPRSPLDPLTMLKVDWETNGWRADVVPGTERVEFLPVEASLFRLGFFDHDRTSNIHASNRAEFSERLQLLGQQLHRGLVQMWIDLQRNRVDDADVFEDERRRTGAAIAQRQSIELLGELLVRPLLEKGLSEGHEPDASYVRQDGAVSDRRCDDGFELEAREASAFLRNLVVEHEGGGSTERVLVARLNKLGMPFENEALGGRKLLRTVEFSAVDFEEQGVDRFRAVINEDVRQLFDFSLLSQYRQSAARRPPRLTVYVIAEMGEAFSRTVMRATLGALHAELMRAYGPIFGSSRQGFDRSLSIVPIMWMPNPADPHGGSPGSEYRVEEAAIIEAIQGTRRWVENLPREVRCISQIFINSRVTETSVLNMVDAVRQTRDFLTFGIRNDVASDRWLRRTAVGDAGDDLFATFSCFGIDFPAERAREYLANRFVRDAMARLRQVHRTEILDTRKKRGERGGASGRELAPLEKTAEKRDEFAPPPLPDLVQQAERRLRQHTERAAGQIMKTIEDQTLVHASQTSLVLQQAFDDAFEDALFGDVHRSWKALSQKRGNMDDMIDDLRRGISAHLMKILDDVRSYSDALIDEHAVSGGLAGAEAHFNALQSATRDQLLQAEHEKQQSEELCIRHRIPDTAPIASSRKELVEAAVDKPDLLPMRAGFLVWLLMAPALGAPIAFTLAQALGLAKNPGVLEFILGPMGPVFGAVLLVLPAAWLLRRHMKQAVARVQKGVRGLIEAVRQVVQGSDRSVFQSGASIQSFFAARLRLTASLASRNFSTHVYEQAVHDRKLAYRLGRSVEIQQEQLTRSAEELGVRPGANSRTGMRGAADAGLDDDTRQLFGTRDGDTVDRLIGPEFLDEYYRLEIGNERDLDAEINQLIEKVGGFESWRTDACFSDTAALLKYGRAKFQSVVERPVCDQSAFEEEVGRRLAGFVARHYPNIGFGARFSGLEGFDEDGMRTLADAALVVEPSLHRVFKKVRYLPGMPPTTETLEIIEASILPNSAYILSLVQGIGSDTIRNLQSFQEHYDRERLANANLMRSFSSKQASANQVITHLTGHRALGESIHAALESREFVRGQRDE